MSNQLETTDHRFHKLKTQLHKQLISNMDFSALQSLSEEELHLEVRMAAEQLCQHSSELLSFDERDRLIEEVLHETFGLGPLEPLLKDSTINDIMINGPDLVFVERNGRMHQVPVSFDSDRHLIQIVQRVIGRVGRRVDEATPLVDARLPDGSRINAVIPPLAIDGALVSIRKFSDNPFLLEDLVGKEAMLQEMAEFLEACVKARLNLIISGGTGSGKTTLLNALSACIPHDERLVTIEDAAELRLIQPHVARMETRPANTEGKGEVDTRDLVKNALRMRPDRIIIGECRGSEAFDMLQAMNTGHEGSMTTIHANDTRDALSRLEMMVGIAGVDLPIWIIRRQISSSIHIIVQTNRLRGGARRVTKISEVTNLEGDTISMHDIFGFKRTGIDQDGNARGYFYASDIRPQCLDEFDEAGIELDHAMFAGQRYEV